MANCYYLTEYVIHLPKYCTQKFHKSEIKHFFSDKRFFGQAIKWLEMKTVMDIHVSQFNAVYCTLIVRLKFYVRSYSAFHAFVVLKLVLIKIQILSGK